MHQVPSFFFTERIGVLHGELVGTSSPQARNLFIRFMDGLSMMILPIISTIMGSHVIVIGGMRISTVLR